jgi:hypothetical protein
MITRFLAVIFALAFCFIIALPAHAQDTLMPEKYAKHYSEEEIKELIVLYKSSAAQKLLRLLPQITAEMIPKAQEWITPTFPQMMEEAFAEEKKKFKTK